MFEFYNNRIYFSALIKSISTLIKFAQSERHSNIYIDRIMAEFVKFLNPDHHGYSFTTTQQEHKGVQKNVCFIIYALNFKNDFLIKHCKRTLQKDIDRKALELHLVSTSAFIEASGCQLPGKEVGDSSSTKTESQCPKSYLMGTNFSKLHPKI